MLVTHKKRETSKMNKDNKITVDLGTEDYYFSIVKVGDGAYSYTELALVYWRPKNSLHATFMESECVPINKWFDSQFVDSETVIRLNKWCEDNKTNYHLLKNATQGEIVASAIARAQKYVDEQTRIVYGLNEGETIWKNYAKS